ncbi:PRC-barrel domain-containing protein [Methanococcus voltae]|uniref:PRC-barrel domain protein n=1 Tax=Methanococcus voltae (strain ATCC BAA-1334 / A3) TaxID=456320 RepID=D7DU28_METV3|nr:PRC-barrel domain-containing protein [Methanococcus voltae]MCS3900438.1 sporulation protein YlmC with PRC-barrel domain [Methanococcus voltae]
MKLSFKSLCGRSIVGDHGSIVGVVNDLVIDEKTGRLVSLNVEVSEQSAIYKKEPSVFIPYRTVSAVRDVVVVDESKMAINN